MLQNPVFTILFASYVVAAWDWMILLPTEYRHIWHMKDLRGQWASTLLYIGCRYYTLVTFAILLWKLSTPSTPESCRNWGWGIPLLSAVSAWFCDLAIALRTYAVWECKRWVGIVMAISWVSEVVMMIACVTVYTTIPQLTGQPGPCIAVENLAGTPSVALLSFIAPATFGVITFCLTGYKLILYRKRSVNSSFIEKLWRCGILYVTCILFCYLINLAFFLQKNASIQALFAGPAFLFPSMIACRIILALRSHSAHTIETTVPTFAMPILSRPRSHNYSQNPTVVLPQDKEGGISLEAGPTAALAKADIIVTVETQDKYEHAV